MQLVEIVFHQVSRVNSGLPLEVSDEEIVTYTAPEGIRAVVFQNLTNGDVGYGGESVHPGQHVGLVLAKGETLTLSLKAGGTVCFRSAKGVKGWMGVVHHV